MVCNINKNGLSMIDFGASNTLTRVFKMYSPTDKDFPNSPVSSVETVTRKPN